MSVIRNSFVHVVFYRKSRVGSDVVFDIIEQRKAVVGQEKAVARQMVAELGITEDMLDSGFGLKSFNTEDYVDYFGS